MHDINTSVLTEWNYERISYKPYVTTREILRITHHVQNVSVVTCLTCNGHICTLVICNASHVCCMICAVCRAHTRVHLMCLMCNGHICTLVICNASHVCFMICAVCRAHTLVSCNVSDLCWVYTLVTASTPDSNSNELVDICKHTRNQSV